MARIRLESPRPGVKQDGNALVEGQNSPLSDRSLRLNTTPAEAVACLASTVSDKNEKSNCRKRKGTNLGTKTKRGRLQRSPTALTCLDAGATTPRTPSPAKAPLSTTSTSEEESTSEESGQESSPEEDSEGECSPTAPGSPSPTRTSATTRPIPRTPGRPWTPGRSESPTLWLHPEEFEWEEVILEKGKARPAITTPATTAASTPPAATAAAPGPPACTPSASWPAPCWRCGAEPGQHPARARSTRKRSTKARNKKKKEKKKKRIAARFGTTGETGEVQLIRIKRREGASVPGKGKAKRAVKIIPLSAAPTPGGAAGAGPTPSDPKDPRALPAKADPPAVTSPAELPKLTELNQRLKERRETIKDGGPSTLAKSAVGPAPDLRRVLSEEEARSEWQCYLLSQPPRSPSSQGSWVRPPTWERLYQLEENGSK